MIFFFYTTHPQYRDGIWMSLLALVDSTAGIWSVLIEGLKKPQMCFINPGWGITMKRYVF